MKITECELIEWLRNGIIEHERVLNTLDKAHIKNDLVTGAELGRIEAFGDILELIENGFPRTAEWKYER